MLNKDHINAAKEIIDISVKQLEALEIEYTENRDNATDPEVILLNLGNLRCVRQGLWHLARARTELDAAVYSTKRPGES